MITYFKNEEELILLKNICRKLSFELRGGNRNGYFVYLPEYNMVDSVDFNISKDVKVNIWEFLYTLIEEREKQKEYKKRVENYLLW